jgi:predicted SAM-dependent methyltransferase
MLKLDLACGKNKRVGYTGVDISPEAGADITQDLLRFPWQWEDNEVEEIHCSHYIEHIPMEIYEGQDLFFRFFDECYRILRPGGIMTVVCPNARSNRAFQDPTHRRFIVGETFFYLNKEWREMQRLDHYNVKCNFGIGIVPIISPELTLLHQDAQARRINECWNVVLDWSAKLTAVK